MKHLRTLHLFIIAQLFCVGSVLAVTPPGQVWVDHAWTGPGDCGGHSWGVDAFRTVSLGVEHIAGGGSVYVAGGSYVEQVAIGADGIQIVGLGSSGDPTTIVSPGVFTRHFFSGAIENWAVIAVEGARGVSLLNLTVDGAQAGYGNGRFSGIAFWNADGLVADCRITGVRLAPATRQYSGVGIYAGNDDRGPYELSILQTVIYGYQANGMLFTGRGLSLAVSSCTVEGRGAMTEIGQTGIQILDGPFGKISDCHVSGHDYVGRGGLVGTGIWVENAGGPVELGYGCTSVNDQVGVLFLNSDGAIRETVIANVGDSRSGIELRNTRVAPVGPGGMQPMGEDRHETGSRPMHVEVSGCDVGGHGVTGIGIITDGGRIEAELAGNKIHNWETGVIVEGRERTVVHAYGNRFYENTYSHAVDNSASPPSTWDLVAGGGPGNYWGDYSGAGVYAIAGTAGAIDHSPNPSTGFALTSASSLLNCGESATLVVTIDPVACMRGYDLLFEFDPTRWNNPTFTNVLPLDAIGEVQSDFIAYAVASGKWRISHTIVGQTSGFSCATPTEICLINLTPKAGAPQGSSSFGLGTRYASVDYPAAHDTFSEDIEAVIHASRPGVSVDCSPPTVTGVTASGVVRDGGVPAVIINGQETPPSGGHVTKLWYQFQPQGHGCSSAPSNWTELAAVSLSWGSWATGRAYQATTVPGFIGPCTMFVMAEDEAGNKGYCAGAASINFTYDPIQVRDDGVTPNTGGPPSRPNELGDAAPNPFVTRTTIPFAISTPSSVRLVIYDVSGRMVRTLADGFLPAGNHIIEWNGMDGIDRPLARGIYFCRLDAGAFHSQKRLLLLN